MNENQIQQIQKLVPLKELHVIYIPSLDPTKHKNYYKIKLVLLRTHKVISASGSTILMAYNNLMEKLDVTD